MEPVTQVPGLSSSEDESPSLVTERQLWKKATQHSTPEEPALGWSSRPPGTTGHLQRSLRLARSPQDHASHLLGVSSTATFRKRKLPTIQASQGSTGGVGPSVDHPAPEKGSPVLASVAKKWQKAEVLGAKSWPGSSELPGILGMAKRKRRNPKSQAAAMQRVRQWERHLLQEIEAAAHHELTIQVVGGPSAGTETIDIQKPDITA